MQKCNSCWFENETSALFCGECGNKLNVAKETNNITTISQEKEINRNDEKEIELNIDLSFITNMWKNQKYILILSWIIFISFILPFLKISDISDYSSNYISKSLFDIGSYSRIIFILPIIFFAIQYYYSVVKSSIYNKWLGQIIIIIISSIVLSIYLLIYTFPNKIIEILFPLINSWQIWFNIWFVLSILWFFWILILSIIETLNIFKKIR